LGFERAFARNMAGSSFKRRRENSVAHTGAVFASALEPESYTMSGDVSSVLRPEMPVLRGRNLEPRDALPQAPAVAVINEAAARKFFPNEDPVGKRFGHIPEQAGYREIVGVVRDARYDNLRKAPPPISFHPFVQSDFRSSFEVRFSGPLPPLIQAIREAVQKADPDLPFVRITTQSDRNERLFWKMIAARHRRNSSGSSDLERGGSGARNVTVWVLCQLRLGFSRAPVDLRGQFHEAGGFSGDIAALEAHLSRRPTFRIVRKEQ
jgi:hypothetical protein